MDEQRLILVVEGDEATSEHGALSSGSERWYAAHERGTSVYAEGLQRLREAGSRLVNRVNAIVVIEVRAARAVVSPAYDDGITTEGRHNSNVPGALRPAPRGGLGLTRPLACMGRLEIDRTHARGHFGRFNFACQGTARPATVAPPWRTSRDALVLGPMRGSRRARRCADCCFARLRKRRRPDARRLLVVVAVA